MDSKNWLIKKIYNFRFFSCFSRSKKRYSAQYKLPIEAYRLASIDQELLMNSGIRGVLLDLDNTIISEDDQIV